MIDYMRLLEKITPMPDGEDVIRLRVGIVDSIESDGRVNVGINGVVIPGVPVLGAAYFVAGSTVQVLSYRGSLLIIGAAGLVASRPVQLTGSEATGTMTQTSFTNTLVTTGIHGVAFIAPPSGIVMVMGRATGAVANLGSRTFLDLEIKTGSVVGSGTVVRSPSMTTASSGTSAISGAEVPHSTSILVSGLTPGAVYNAALVYNSSNGAVASTFNRRYVAVIPE